MPHGLASGQAAHFGNLADDNQRKAASALNLARRSARRSEGIGLHRNAGDAQFATNYEAQTGRFDDDGRLIRGVGWEDNDQGEKADDGAKSTSQWNSRRTQGTNHDGVARTAALALIVAPRIGASIEFSRDAQFTPA
ncbi:MAG: hypothetical protein SFU86_01540 [Pirellulaceae bacterium]|nr:hypothetical protein [Pirellulaceae bacterium]